ncbi:D-2-hydroxyacid dehydrogenase [Pareuzebyella sediminis]|uniref:D-2-hydroxyacid dehydrogenase n=1 Tax=Pareuzebyella sediminis TaxID=2607998 RepID=UPI0011EEE1BD|nr:D-2-hydroxyacid dehydrogenase [Pareuzebyella sediminis]
MKIVVLDGFTLNPGDLDWATLEALGELTVYDRTDYEEADIIVAIGDAEAIFTNKTPLSKGVLEKTRTVRYIGVLATGYNVVDIETAKNLNITVTNVPTYGTQAVAQMTMALLLEMCHHVGEHNRAVQNGQWAKSKDFCFWNYPLVELDGKTMGIVGFGRIGQATAKLARAFGMRILTTGSSTKPEPKEEGYHYVSLEELLAQSDVVSLHCPLNEETEGMINANSIATMKEGVLFINTSRGQLVNEEDLKKGLEKGKIAYAAVDVVSQEPIAQNNPLLGVENCIITPHISWAPRASRNRLMTTAIANFKAFILGRPENVVNG